MFARRLTVQNTTIYITTGFFPSSHDLSHVFALDEPQPVIRVEEDEVFQRAYRLETLAHNPDLTGHYLHVSIRVTAEGAVMIDGILSKDRVTHPSWQAAEYEALRLQPFFLRAYEAENRKLQGAGLFERGLHYPGHITPRGVRCVCICDHCQQSFSLHHLHAGFADGQYFYSGDSRQTLFIGRDQLPGLSRLSQPGVSLDDLHAVEAQLPCPTVGTGVYAYYNPFRCPHCGAVFIDFAQQSGRRAAEYYGNYLLNHSLQRLE